MTLESMMSHLRNGHFGDPRIVGVRAFDESGNYPLGDTVAFHIGKDLPSFLNGLCDELKANGLEMVGIRPKGLEAVSVNSGTLDSETEELLSENNAVLLDYSCSDIFKRAAIANIPEIILDAADRTLSFRFSGDGYYMETSVSLAALDSCLKSADRNSEQSVMALYGLTPPYETVREYAGIELIESDYGTEKVLRDIGDAIMAAEAADDGQTLNPWFTDRQIGIINSYMDGEFGSELLTSGEDARPLAYECDALLGHLVAACDPAFSDWRERLQKIRRDAENPLSQDELNDCAKVIEERAKNSSPKNSCMRPRS